MAVTSSLTLPLTPKLCKKACKACGLNIYQGPVFEKLKRSNIFWVGLSAVKFADNEEKLPLSPSTNSGALIETIELPLKESIHFYKTNLVKCAPLQADKVRYPIAHEMDKCFPNLQWEIEHLQPSIVFLLGKQVSSFVLKKFSQELSGLADNFEYAAHKIGSVVYIPIHHPSYILVYKRRHLEQYILSLQKLIASLDKKKRKKVPHFT